MKKNKSKPCVLLLATLLMGTISYAQSMYFSYSDGTNTSYNLEDVRKITFDADMMNLHLWDGSLYTWNVGTIGYYQYFEIPLNMQEWLNCANSWEVKVCPNPTSNSVTVHFNLPKTDEVSITLSDIQGKLILEKHIGKKETGKHQETFDLNSIPSGTYVCSISGQKNMVTKKIIKQ
jgi:hypothetical protein